MRGWRNRTALRLERIGVLVERELRVRYKGSFFGIMWAILSPLGTVAILQFVFSRVLTVNVPNFGAFIYSGLLPWVWFSVAVQTGAATLMENRDLVRTPFFTKSLLPAVVTCTHFLLYLAALPVLLLLVAMTDQSLTTTLLVLPVIWAIQALLTLGFTLLVAAIGVLVRDVQHLIGVVLAFWFYLTPIFYDLGSMPDDVRQWLELNPMTAIVSAHRAVTLYGDYPDWSALAGCAAIGGVLLAASLAIFRALEDAFIEHA